MKTLMNALFSIVLSFSSLHCYGLKTDEKDAPYSRIAIIGGGIGGTFAAKYLSDYDDKCLLDITLFNPDESPGDQGSRVSSFALDDGTMIELGASIIFEGNRLVNEMIDGDDELVKTKPHSPGPERNDFDVKTGMGVYNGDSEEPFSLLMANMTPAEIKKTLLWRYNMDLWRMNRATNNALDSFNLIYDLLDSKHVSTFFESPNDVWRAVGLAHAASVSFDEYLDSIGVASSISWLRKLLSDQGVMRSELYTAMNICNNNQINSQMTGLAGLVNSAALTGQLYAVEGGNQKLQDSAFRQAKRKHDEVCIKKDMYGESKIRQVPKKVKTLVSDFENGMELFDASGKLLGTFDIVILAAPLQFSGINFLGRGSMFDSSVLHTITLNEMVDSEDSNANEHGHKNAFGSHMPSSATRPYTQVVTTIISHGQLNRSYFSLGEDAAPRSILFTEEGREKMGISSIGQITGGVYKVFSSEELRKETVATLFGSDAVIERVKVWGGKSGGATPAFNGGGESSYSTQFKLYDGGHGSSSFSEHSALYYTNAMEAAVSAIEISALGSKSVAKLIARRLGLLQPTDSNQNDEL